MLGTEELTREHRVIEVILTVMQRAAAEGHWEDIGDCLDFFRGFADRCHHGKEEQFLLPAMEKKGIPKEGSPIEAILEDHHWGRELLQKIEDSLPAARSRESCGRESAAYHILVYSSMLFAHIGKEDNVLFVMADQVLDETEQADLAAAYEEFEHKTLGPDYHRHYHRLAEDLAARYGLKLG